MTKYVIQRKESKAYIAHIPDVNLTHRFGYVSQEHEATRFDYMTEAIMFAEIAGICEYEVKPVLDTSFYTVEIDGTKSEIPAASLAALANLIRGKGKHIRVWSNVGVPLIDTKFGDTYDLIV